MNSAELRNIRIEGIASSVPKRTAQNLDCELIPLKERDLFIRSTGIESRRVAAKGTCTSDLCVHAAEQLMGQLGWYPSDLRIIVLVTQTPDHITPSTAAIIQNRLGCSTDCAAFDVNLGCSGYVYGLWTLASLLQGMPNGTKALLLAGDVSTACISPSDRSTVPLFSDAGSATAMVKDRTQQEPLHFALSTNGAAKESIWIPAGGYRNPFDATSLEATDHGAGIVRRPIDLILNGIDVYQQAAQCWPQQVTRLATSTGMALDSVDHAVFHQANRVINEMVRKRSGLTESQTASSLRELGNSGTASIPVTMAHCLRDELCQAPKRMLLSGFGVGLSWATMIADLPAMKSVTWAEYED
jgi:3-oxoacyl-[acyl-carrier-protein] synthase III